MELFIATSSSALQIVGNVRLSLSAARTIPPRINLSMSAQYVSSMREVTMAALWRPHRPEKR